MWDGRGAAQIGKTIAMHIASMGIDLGKTTFLSKLVFTDCDGAGICEIAS